MSIIQYLHVYSKMYSCLLYNTCMSTLKCIHVYYTMQCMSTLECLHIQYCVNFVYGVFSLWCINIEAVCKKLDNEWFSVYRSYRKSHHGRIGMGPNTQHPPDIWFLKQLTFCPFKSLVISNEFKTLYFSIFLGG